MKWKLGCIWADVGLSEEKGGNPNTEYVVRLRLSRDSAGDYMGII